MSSAPHDQGLSASLERRVLMLRTAMGPDIAKAALNDPDVVEVMLNPDGSLWVDRLGSGREPLGVSLTPADGERIIRLVAAHVAPKCMRASRCCPPSCPRPGNVSRGRCHR
jgi:Flp pilus assembly CpaF family ATPase